MVAFQSIDDVYWTEDAADEDMMNTYCWMYGHLNLPHDYMVIMLLRNSSKNMESAREEKKTWKIICDDVQGHCTRRNPDPTILYNTYYQ